VTAGNHKPAVQKTPSIPLNLSAVKKIVDEKPLLRKDAASTPPDKTADGVSTNRKAPDLNRAKLDQEKIQDVLDDIIQEFRTKAKHMEISVIRQGFKIQEGKVVFLLNGAIQKDIFLKIKPELTGL